jgi:hypothetical protein
VRKKKVPNGHTVRPSQQHNMQVYAISEEDKKAEFIKQIQKPKVGISTTPKSIGVKGRPGSNPRLVKYRRSFSKTQIHNIIENLQDKGKYIPHQSVFVGAASKAEKSQIRGKDSKVVGLIFNPLDDEAFLRLEDAFISDGELRQSIYKYWGLILGNQFLYKLGDCYQNYGDDDERNAAYDEIMNHEPYRLALDKCIRLLEKCKFKNTWESICNLATVFGRGAAEIIRDDTTNDPVFLNMLYSQLLGDPILNKYHQFIGVEYEDLPDQEQNKHMTGSINKAHKAAFKKEKLLYYAHNDTPVTVGAKYYGLAMEDVIDASETKRIMIQKELKEWVSKSHTGNVILSTDEPLPQEECDAIAERLTNNQGNVTMLNYKVMAQIVSVSTNIDKFEALIDMLNREMLRAVDIIGPLGGYENIQNYASIAKLIVVWMASTLNPQRLKQKQIIKEQFVDGVFQNCLLQHKQIILEDPQTLKLKLYDVVIPETDKPEDIPGSPKYSVRETYEMIQKRLKVDPDFINNPIEDLEFNETDIPAAEIIIDIDLPRFNDFVEIADKISSWVRERMMTKAKGLEIAGMEDQIDDIKQLDQEAAENREALMGKGVMFDEQGKPIPGNTIPQNMSMTDSNVQAKVTNEGNKKMAAVNPKFKDPTQRTKAETQSLNKKLAKKDKTGGIGYK